MTASRELDEPVHGGFYWGYNGGGPARAATAILADALNPGGPVPSGLDPTAATQDATLGALRSDFCRDVLSQLCEEWRLRRAALGPRLVHRARANRPAAGSCPAPAR